MYINFLKFFEAVAVILLDVINEKAVEHVLVISGLNKFHRNIKFIINLIRSQVFFISLAIDSSLYLLINSQ